MTFHRTTTFKLLVLAGIWFGVTRLGFLFVNSTPPTPDPNMDIPVTVPARGISWFPVALRFTEKVDATLQVRLRSPTPTEVQLVAYDEAGYSIWKSGGKPRPFYSAMARTPFDGKIPIPSPEAVQPQGSRKTCYLVFLNLADSPKHFTVMAWPDDPAGNLGALIPRLTFGLLLMVSIFITVMAAARRKWAQPVGEYAVPSTRG